MLPTSRRRLLPDDVSPTGITSFQLVDIVNVEAFSVLGLLDHVLCKVPQLAYRLPTTSQSLVCALLSSRQE